MFGVQGVWNYLERYGWYTLIAAGILFAIYQKYLADKIQDYRQIREEAILKKDDDAQRDKHREKLEQVRAKQQEEYAQEVAREQERQKVLAEQRKKQKYGISEEGDAQEQAQAPFNALDFVKAEIAAKPVVIFSKSWCPYSRKAKQILLGIYRIEAIQYSVIELDEHKHGDLIQDALQRLTGGRSVPRCFIAGQFIGGGDDVEKKHKESALSPLLKAANVKFAE